MFALRERGGHMPVAGISHHRRHHTMWTVFHDVDDETVAVMVEAAEAAG
jgi:hypothetical protein